MQGLYDAKIVLDETVTEQKLTDDVVLKLNTGGGSTEPTDNVPSSSVKDDIDRSGYQPLRDTVDKHLDAIAEELRNKWRRISNMLNKCCVDTETRIYSSTDRIDFENVPSGNSEEVIVAITAVHGEGNVTIDLSAVTPSGDITVTPTVESNTIMGGFYTVKYQPQNASTILSGHITFGTPSVTLQIAVSGNS